MDAKKTYNCFLFSMRKRSTEFHRGRTCIKIKPAVSTHLPAYERPWGKSLRILPKFHHFLPLHKTGSGCHLQMVTFRHMMEMGIATSTSMLANAAGR